VIRHIKDFGAIILCDERFQYEVRCMGGRLFFFFTNACCM